MAAVASPASRPMLGVSYLAVPEISSPTTLSRVTTSASDSDEELNSLLERLELLLGELSTLGEVLVAGGRLQVPPQTFPCALAEQRKVPVSEGFEELGLAGGLLHSGCSTGRLLHL